MPYGVGMQPTPESVERLRAQAERLRGQVERATGAFHTLMGRFEELEATAVSDDRLVTATVGADGRLRRLELDPGIYRHPDAAGLARLIEATIASAAADAQEQTKEMLAPFVPGDLVDAHLNRDTDAIVGGVADLLRER